MLKNVVYNQSIKGREKPTMYKEEMRLIHEWYGSGNENIGLEYDSLRAAINARNALSKAIKADRIPVKIKRRNTTVFAVRDKEEAEVLLTAKEWIQGHPIGTVRQ